MVITDFPMNEWFNTFIDDRLIYMRIHISGKISMKPAANNRDYSLS